MPIGTTVSGASAWREDPPAARAWPRQGHAARRYHRDCARRRLVAAGRAIDIAEMAADRDRGSVFRVGGEDAGTGRAHRIDGSCSTPSAGARTTARPAAPEAPPAAADPLPSSPAASTSDVPPRSAAVSPTMAAVPPPAAGADEPSAAPLPPPTADPADPYQEKRLRPSDFTPTCRASFWGGFPRPTIAMPRSPFGPPRRDPDASVFVLAAPAQARTRPFPGPLRAGAAPGCRRYVVTVTKDRWSTRRCRWRRCSAQPHRPQRS